MNFSEDNFVTIQGWMRTGLGLKGNDLLVYAAIYGFSQKEEQWFTGGQQYLAELCGCSLRGVWKNLDKLKRMGLIEVSLSDQDARWNKYRTTDVRKIPEQSSDNKIPELSSEIHELSSDNKNKIPELRDKIPELRDKNTGTQFVQNINKYNNIYNIPSSENKNNINIPSSTPTRAREESIHPVDELSNERRKEIIRIWNRQQLTKDIMGIHFMSARENNTRLCIGRFGYDRFLETISHVDSQAFFRRVFEEEQNPLTYDWFVKPDNFQKVVEGNYKEKRKSKSRAEPKKTALEEWEEA